MMKKRLFILLFLLLSLLPSLGMLLLGPSPLLANESATKTPHLNAELFRDLTDYMGARFALRPYLVSARSFLYEKLFHSSAEEQVVLGRDGELFYSSTIADYCGQGLTDEDLQRVADNLLEIQRNIENRGGQFLFVVAPNKNSLKSELMPARFPENQSDSNYVRLLPLLEELGVHTVDLHTMLSGRAELYYTTDSHWTAEGAAIAADALLQALGRKSSFASGPFTGDGWHAGDLYQMLYPTGKGREAELSYAPGFRHTTASDPRGGNAITIRTQCETGTGTLYCRRASFGIALYPYLAEAFASAEFSRSDDYSSAAFDMVSADVVILEIVERNIDTLLGK